MTHNFNIFNPLFEDILAYVNRACSELGIDFYVAGAVARDYHLNKTGDYVPSRRTADIDLAVMVSDESEFNALKDALLKTGEFQAHAEPIKLIFKHAIELDLLPFGDIEENGITKLTQPRIFTLDMPGFSLLNDSAEHVLWNDKVEARVCSIEGIVLLKLIAQDDRPQRTKDNADIQQIIKMYFEIYSDDIYENHYDLMEKYNVDDSFYIHYVCAHVIGRRLKTILSEDISLRDRIVKILEKDKDRFWNQILNGLNEK